MAAPLSARCSCRRRRANGTAQQPAAQQPIAIDDSESASEDDSGESSNSDSDAEDADSPASTGDAASPAVNIDAEAPFDVMLTCVATLTDTVLEPIGTSPCCHETERLGSQ